MMQVHTSGSGLAGVYPHEAGRDQGGPGRRVRAPRRLPPPGDHGAGLTPCSARRSRIVLTIAYREAISRRHAYLTLEHLLYALAHDPDGERILAAAAPTCRGCGSDLDRVPGGRGRAGPPRAREREPEQTRGVPARAADGRAARAERAAAAKCRPATSWRPSCSSPSRRPRALLAGAGRHPPRHPRLHLARHLEGAARRRRRDAEEPARAAGAAPARTGRRRRAIRSSAYCRNLTERARGRASSTRSSAARRELQRTIEVLCRRRKNNPVFVGDAGVGKTAMAEGLATRLLRRRRAGRAEGCRGVLARHGAPAGRHAFPRRLRGAVQGRASRRSAPRPRADPLHRRNPLDGRRRRDDGRHDGPGDADQADPHGRRACA